MNPLPRLDLGQMRHGLPGGDEGLITPAAWISDKPTETLTAMPRSTRANSA